MTTHRTLATWTHEGARYSVSVAIEDGEAKEVVIEEVIGDQTRCASVPARIWTLEDLHEAWTTEKRLDVRSFRAKHALDLAWEI
jgi:hypothetical protein